VTIYDNILNFEAGKLSDSQIIDLFSGLVDTGAIWNLPVQYQETAAVLINKGLLKNKENLH
jgi:hypothetical protein